MTWPLPSHVEHQTLLLPLPLQPVQSARPVAPQARHFPAISLLPRHVGHCRDPVPWQWGQTTLPAVHSGQSLRTVPVRLQVRQKTQPLLAQPGYVGI